MNSIRWSRSVAALLTVAIIGSIVSVPGQPVRSQEPSTDDKRPVNQLPAAAEAGKTDLFGDPLPAGALARMGTVRWRHSGSISFVGYTAQGKQLITACSDGFFRVWDVSSGKEIRRFSMGAAANVPRGGIAKAAGGVYFLGNNGRIVLSNDGASLATMGADGNARIWDVVAGKEVRTLSVKQEPNPGIRMFRGGGNLAFSPDGKSLATQSNDRVIHLWDVASGKEIRHLGLLTRR
jgi:WD40 repeat protein